MSQHHYGKIPIQLKAPLLKQHYVVFYPQNDHFKLIFEIHFIVKGRMATKRSKKRQESKKKICKNEFKIIIRKVEKREIGRKVGKKVDVDQI